MALIGEEGTLVAFLKPEEQLQIKGKRERERERERVHDTFQLVTKPKINK